MLGAVVLVCALLPRGREAGWRDEFLADSSIATSRRLGNLRRVLEFVRNSPDFRPLTLSVMSSGPSPEIPDYVGRYAAANSLDAYQTNALDFPRVDEWQRRSDLTWIFLVEDSYALRSFVDYQRAFWRGQHRYVIVFYDARATIDWWSVLEALWRRYSVYKVIVTLADDEFQWFRRYLPFELVRGEHGNLRSFLVDENPPERPVSREVGDATLVATESTVFGDLADMNGYPLNVTAFTSLTMMIHHVSSNETRFSGLDAEMMNLVERSLRCKFKQQVIEPSSYRDPFQTALRDIEERQTEIVFTGFFTKTYENFSELAFTTGIYQDKLCFIAPQAPYIPKAYMPAVPFPRKLWSILALYNLVVTVLWILVKHWSGLLRRRPRVVVAKARRSRVSVSRRKARFRSTFIARPAPVQGFPAVWRTSEKAEPIEPIAATSGGPPEIRLDVLGLFNLVVFAIYPLKGGDATTSQRTFLAGILFFSVVIGGLYQSRLVSSFSKPYYYPQIDTMQDVIDSNYTLVTKYANLMSIFSDSKSSPDDRKILERFQLISLKQSTYARVAYEKVIALSRLLAMEMEDLTSYYDEYGNSLLHAVGECPATYMISYVVTPNSPYVGRIDSLILRMQQSGIVHQWLTNMKLKIDKTNRRVRMTRQERKIKLSFEHYSLTFLGLFIGLASSSLVFLGELYYAKKLRLRRLRWISTLGIRRGPPGK